MTGNITDHKKVTDTRTQTVRIEQIEQQYVADHMRVPDLEPDDTSWIWMQYGFDLALFAVEQWAKLEPDAAKSVWQAWHDAMTLQDRPHRDRDTWQALDRKERVLDAAIAKQVVFDIIKHVRGTTDE